MQFLAGLFIVLVLGAPIVLGFTLQPKSDN